MADLDPILVARFWSKVEVGRPVECWPWRASRDKDGYGQFKGMASANPQRAHRVAYALVWAPIYQSDLISPYAHIA